jgi:hypothetical protein
MTLLTYLIAVALAGVAAVVFCADGSDFTQF